MFTRKLFGTLAVIAATAIVPATAAAGTADPVRGNDVLGYSFGATNPGTSAVLGYSFGATNPGT
jgi:hypothetical protein